MPILPPDRIRTLPFGTGVTLLRSAPPIITDLTAWPTRPDAEALKRGRARLEQLLQNPVHDRGRGVHLTGTSIPHHRRAAVHELRGTASCPSAPRNPCPGSSHPIHS